MQFENISGKTYKNVKISNSPFAGKEIDIRVDKTSGVVYGVSGTAGTAAPKFSSALQIVAKTKESSDFSVYDMTEDAENTRLYTYSFDTTSVEMSFLYDGDSADLLVSAIKKRAGSAKKEELTVEIHMAKVDNKWYIVKSLGVNLILSSVRTPVASVFAIISE